VSWDQRLFDPITVPGRKPLVTLRDAAQYIIELPTAERELPEWETDAGRRAWRRSDGAVYRNLLFGRLGGCETAFYALR
jgi:hypothetical protein